MTKEEKILSNIQKDKYLSFKKVNYYDCKDFLKNAKTYIKAIKENRMICNIGSVSNSGMSRTIKFMSCEKSNSTPKKYYYRNYWSFFKVLGYPEVKKSGYFRIQGCGMDMIFHTNYSIIHDLERLGFINKKECDNLAQQTPPVI